MVVFTGVPSRNGSIIRYRMHRNSEPVVAVHQVLRTAYRPLEHVLFEMRPGEVFCAQQAPAPNTNLRLISSLDRDALFPYDHTLQPPFDKDRLSLVIADVLAGSSRTDPIDGTLPALYCVYSGIIDSVHIETTPERRERYRRVMRADESSGLVFYHRTPEPVSYLHQPLMKRSFTNPFSGENRERL